MRVVSRRATGFKGHCSGHKLMLQLLLKAHHIVSLLAVGGFWLVLTWQATLSCFAKTEMHFCLINKTSDSVCTPRNYATMGENARMVLQITVA